MLVLSEKEKANISQKKVKAIAEVRKRWEEGDSKTFCDKILPSIKKSLKTWPIGEVGKITKETQPRQPRRPRRAKRDKQK